MKSKAQILGYGLYLIIAIITSAPFFIKHSSKYFIFIAIYAIVLSALVVLLQRFDLRQFGILNHHLPWVLGILLLAVLNVFLYPQTRLAPSTAPNALMEPAIALIRTGADPYSVRLFDGSPISPGPGWILLNALFALSGLITLLTPVYLALAAGMIAKWSKAYSFIFVLLLLCSVNFIQLSSTGHDLAATSLAFVCLALLLYRHSQNNFLFYLIAILTGLVATARVPFIIMPIALSICLSTMDRKRAIQFGIVSTGFALMTHLIFYLWAAKDGLFYQPLHVFGRASHGSPILILGVGALIWIASGFYMGRHLTKNPASWLIFLWTTLAIPFIFVGLGELINNGLFSATVWGNWEGKGYVMFTLPLLLAGLVLYAAQRSIENLT